MVFGSFMYFTYGEYSILKPAHLQYLLRFISWCLFEENCIEEENCRCHSTVHAGQFRLDKL